MPTFIKKWMMYVILVIAGLYACLVAMVYKKQESLLFYPSEVNAEFKEAADKYEKSFEIDGVNLNGWLVNPKKETLVIYYGGNAEELSSLVSVMQGYPNSATLLINYRGYGESSGTPSEEALFSDALTIYDRMAPAYKKVVLVGRSLGSGVACYVAAHRNVDGVVLITPFDSMVKVAQEQFRWAPMSLLVKHRFESDKYAGKATAPCLFIVAERDQIVSTRRSQALFDVWAGEKKLELLDGHDHNSFSLGSGSASMVQNFIFRVSRRR